MSKDNLELWNKVEKTNPKYTKKAKVGGNQITSISPQFQVMNATEQFGSYGSTWGFKHIELDYSLTSTPTTLSLVDWNTKAETKLDTILGLVGFKAVFFYPDGEFEIINSIKIFTDNKHSKIDDNFAKKLETDTLTKALSKLGFNADIFLGKFDDVRYLADVTKEFTPKPEPKKVSRVFTALIATEESKKNTTIEELKKRFDLTEAQETKYKTLLK
jgi:hypothetical protein